MRGHPGGLVECGLGMFYCLLSSFLGVGKVMTPFVRGNLVVDFGVRTVDRR
jgi:hypothetical protein